MPSEKPPYASPDNRRVWIVERYAYGDLGDYPTWMPVEDATYYASREEAQAALDAIADDEYQRAKEHRERDMRDCADRAAVVAAARAAVEGMPQAHIIGNGWRTEPIPEPKRSTSKLRVAEVTTFQQRVQALLDDTRDGEMVDADDLRRCFEEATDA